MGGGVNFPVIMKLVWNMAKLVGRGWRRTLSNLSTVCLAVSDSPSYRNAIAGLKWWNNDQSDDARKTFSLAFRHSNCRHYVHVHVHSHVYVQVVCSLSYSYACIFTFKSSRTLYKFMFVFVSMSLSVSISMFTFMSLLMHVYNGIICSCT